MEIDAAFGNWLAGFIDGEGCFTIMYARGDSPQLYTRFQIRLRADDGDVLREIQRRTGVGRLYSYAPTKRALARHPGSKANVLWVVGTTAGCACLVEILERFPLRAKKARDFEVWRAAVSARAARDWALMDALKQQMEAGREFDAIPQSELPPPAQLRLVS